MVSGLGLYLALCLAQIPVHRRARLTLSAGAPTC